MSRSAVASLAVLALPVVLLADGASRWNGFSSERLSPEMRRAIDQRAVQSPAENSKIDVQLEFYGDVTSWLISRTPLPEGEEVQRAAETHRQIAEHVRLSPPPPRAQRVFRRLVEQLPQKMRRPGFDFSLALIEEPGREAFTAGAGRVYVPRDYLDALLADRQSGDDRLAFVLGHELGHVCRRHTRRGYQLLWLKEHLKNGVNNGVDSERLRTLLERSIDTTGRWLTFLYSDEQEYKADLFAVHLCRNAGFDLDVALDPLREKIVRGQSRNQSRPLPARRLEEGALLAEERLNGLGDRSASSSLRKVLWRLKRIREDLDGTVAGEQYGLFLFDPATGAASELQPGVIEKGERVVVFVHGMESQVKVFQPLAEHLRTKLPVRLLAFQYPNDGSLARSGKFLKAEIARCVPSPGQADFVCHSAGGLVFRWYAEVEGGHFRTAAMMGTPNRGSDLAKLRTLLEAKQLVGDFKLGYSDALQQVILDSKGLIGFDLHPDSLFLRYLNRPRQRSDKIRPRYAVIRGRALKRRYALLARGSVAAGRIALARLTKKWDGKQWLRDEAERWIRRLRVPREVSRGDLVVTLESADLKGAGRVQTVRVDHTSMLRDPEVLEAVTEWLLSEKPANPG